MFVTWMILIFMTKSVKYNNKFLSVSNHMYFVGARFVLVQLLVLVVYGTTQTLWLFSLLFSFHNLTSLIYNDNNWSAEILDE